jgi:hypothetical protein
VLSRKKPPLLCATIAISLSSSGCTLLNPNRQNWIYGGSPRAQVLLAYDSPEVRRLLADEDAREYEVNRFWQDKHTPEERGNRTVDMMIHPERYPPGRSDFLEAMANLPGFSVPSKSYCRVLESSKSTCGRTPIETAFYVLVRVTTGPARGKKGWVCSSNAPQLFPVAHYRIPDPIKSN